MMKLREEFKIVNILKFQETVINANKDNLRNQRLNNYLWFVNKFMAVYYLMKIYKSVKLVIVITFTTKVNKFVKIVDKTALLFAHMNKIQKFQYLLTLC